MCWSLLLSNSFPPLLGCVWGCALPFRGNWPLLCSASGRRLWEQKGGKKAETRIFLISLLPGLLAMTASSPWHCSPGVHLGPVGRPCPGLWKHHFFPLPLHPRGWLIIPCFVSQLFHQLGKQSPALNSHCFKYLEWFLLIWLEPDWHKEGGQFTKTSGINA